MFRNCSWVEPLQVGYPIQAQTSENHLDSRPEQNDNPTGHDHIIPWMILDKERHA
jgi:hypothetical protein